MTGDVGGRFRPIRLPAVDVVMVREVLERVEGRYAGLTGGRITLSGLVIALAAAALEDPSGWIGEARDDRLSRARWQPRTALSVVWPRSLLGDAHRLADVHGVPVSGVLGAALRSQSAKAVCLLDLADNGDATAQAVLESWLSVVQGDRRLTVSRSG